MGLGVIRNRVIRNVLINTLLYDMNAEIFYKSIEVTLGPVLNEIGFVRLKERRPIWMSRVQNQDVCIEMRYGKYPWEPYCGGRFSVFIREKGKPDDSIESLFGEINIDDMEMALSITESCAEKLRKADLNDLSDDDNVAEMYESWRQDELSEMTPDSIKKEFSLVINPQLPFYDEHDAQQWGLFVGRVATNLFQEKVNFV